MWTVEWQRSFEGLHLQFETHVWNVGDRFDEKASQFNFQQACVRRPVRARLARPIGSQCRLGALVLTPADLVMPVVAVGDETGFPVRKFSLDTDWFNGLLSPRFEFDFAQIEAQPVFDNPLTAATLDRISAELLSPTRDSADMLDCLVRMLAIDTARLLKARAAATTYDGTKLTADQLARVNWSIEITDPAELSAEKISGDCEMSVSRLRDAYRRTTGQSLRSRIEEARQLSACRLLTTTGQPLKMIAHRMGFTHSSAFCYWFKKSVGLTPGEYRISNASSPDPRVAMQ
ncbi:helix-turn-helix transcriptional regulator [Sphingosinicella sp.]|uniref:helix-turn-helix transcriptional regulator n=1 Tax=Sphingosinicella sp. TaxID=1917971 RepID=UPI001810D588|nr:helix-turn-helix transcriptional regulator [Sphingosinicella sp.]MBA4760075.1 helix-turn-helix transcriptional regulator [Sphingosinicella sp.]